MISGDTNSQSIAPGMLPLSQPTAAVALVQPSATAHPHAVAAAGTAAIDGGPTVCPHVWVLSHVWPSRYSCMVDLSNDGDGDSEVSVAFAKATYCRAENLSPGLLCSNILGMGCLGEILLTFWGV